MKMTNSIYKYLENEWTDKWRKIWKEFELTLEEIDELKSSIAPPLYPEILPLIDLPHPHYIN